MQFKSNEDQKIDVMVEYRCADGCCSWREAEYDWVGRGQVYEPEFDYLSSMVEVRFFYDVFQGQFDPADHEAQMWFEEKMKEFEPARYEKMMVEREASNRG